MEIKLKKICPCIFLVARRLNEAREGIAQRCTVLVCAARRTGVKDTSNNFYADSPKQIFLTYMAHMFHTVFKSLIYF